MSSVACMSRVYEDSYVHWFIMFGWCCFLVHLKLLQKIQRNDNFSRSPMGEKVQVKDPGVFCSPFDELSDVSCSWTLYHPHTAVGRYLNVSNCIRDPQNTTAIAAERCFINKQPPDFRTPDKKHHHGVPHL